MCSGGRSRPPPGGRSGHPYTSVDASSSESAFSNGDLATTIIFTDATPAGMPIRAVHITELRTAVNAVRTLATLGAYSFTDSVITAGITTAKAAHINDLRTALTVARAALALSVANYVDPTITTSTSVKAAHIVSLRNAIR